MHHTFLYYLPLWSRILISLCIDWLSSQRNSDGYRFILCFCTMRLCKVAWQRNHSEKNEEDNGETKGFSTWPMHVKGKGKAIPVTGRGGPIGLWDIEAPTFSRILAHRWRWGRQPYTPAAFSPPGRFLALISVTGWVEPRATVRLGGLGKLKKIQWPHRKSNPQPSGL
jgi:hypothetical protein